MSEIHSLERWAQALVILLAAAFACLTVHTVLRERKAPGQGPNEGGGE